MPMPIQTDPVQKPAFLVKLCEASQRRKDFDLDQILTTLGSGRNLVDIGKDYGLITSDAEEQHLRRDWYDETNQGWWKSQQPVEPIVRQAYIEAIRLVQEHDLPLEALWVCGGDRFQVALSKGINEITMLLHTPHIDGAASTVTGEDENLRVIERDESGEVRVRKACCFG
jgi:hypothetical protein